jgi:hypothetical protein
MCGIADDGFLWSDMRVEKRKEIVSFGIYTNLFTLPEKGHDGHERGPLDGMYTMHR